MGGDQPRGREQCHRGGKSRIQIEPGQRFYGGFRHGSETGNSAYGGERRSPATHRRSGPACASHRSMERAGVCPTLGVRSRRALVTAASRGLDRGCAQQLAADQCRVAICSRDETAAKKAAKEIADQSGAEVLGFGADVSRGEQVDRLLEDVRQSLGDPEILVTNAGGPPPGTFAGTALEEYEKALNLKFVD